MVEYWLLVVADLRVITTATASEHALHSAGHSLRPLHRAHETVVHRLTGVAIGTPLHAHNMQSPIALLKHLLVLLFGVLILVLQRNAIHRHVSCADAHRTKIIFGPVCIGLGRHIVNSV